MVAVDRHAQPGRKAGAGQPYSKTDLGLALLIAILGTVVYLGVMHRFESVRAFARDDTLFHADARFRLDCMSFHPELTGGRVAFFGSRHPFWVPLASAPGRVIHSASRVLAPLETPVVERRAVALATTPVLGGIGLAVLYLLLRRLGARRSGALAVGLLGTFAWTALIFNSIPEHFAWAHLGFLVGLLLAAEALLGDRIWWLAWALVGALLLACSITNLLPFALLFEVSVFVRRPDRRARAISVGTLVVLALLGAYGVASHGVGRFSGPDLIETAVEQYQQPLSVETLLRSIAAMPNSIMPAVVVSRATPEGLRFSLEGSPSAADLARLGVVLGLVAFGAWRVIASQERGLRAFALAVGGVLLFHLVLHTVWGPEFFLYSGHWLGALLTLVGLGALPGAWQRGYVVVVTALALGVAAANLAHLESITSMLGAGPVS